MNTTAIAKSGTYQLIPILLKGSYADNWLEARYEFEHTESQYSEEAEVCTCGHNPIHNLNWITNNVTKKVFLIGSCCIKQFLPGLSNDKLFEQMKLGRLTPLVAQDFLLKKYVTEFDKPIFEAAAKGYKKIGFKIFLDITIGTSPTGKLVALSIDLKEYIQLIIRSPVEHRLAIAASRNLVQQAVYKLYLKYEGAVVECVSKQLFDTIPKYQPDINGEQLTLDNILVEITSIMQDPQRDPVLYHKVGYDYNHTTKPAVSDILTNDDMLPFHEVTKLYNVFKERAYMAIRQLDGVLIANVKIPNGDKTALMQLGVELLTRIDNLKGVLTAKANDNYLDNKIDFWYTSAATKYIDAAIEKSDREQTKEQVIAFKIANIVKYHPNPSDAAKITSYVDNYLAQDTLLALLKTKLAETIAAYKNL